MSEQETNRPTEAVSRKRKFQIEEAILILMLVFSLGGVAITGFSATEGYRYWMAMLVFFALASIVLAVPATLAIHIATQGKGFGIITPVAAGILMSAAVFIAPMLNVKNAKANTV